MCMYDEFYVKQSVVLMGHNTELSLRSLGSESIDVIELVNVVRLGYNYT